MMSHAAINLSSCALIHGISTSRKSSTNSSKVGFRCSSHVSTINGQTNSAISVKTGMTWSSTKSLIFLKPSVTLSPRLVASVLMFVEN